MTNGPLTLGTAGHIDHGKSTLIRALTGTDTDRLPQERERGISIELGYASLTLPSGTRVSIVDAPGHERYVRTMVAGSTGIDLYLMVIAADDGVMPQTREHAAVLRALEIRSGVVAITKSDLADPEPAEAQAAELLPEAEVVRVSAVTGAGLAQLRAALDGLTRDLPSRAAAPGPARLHIDRAFTIRGAGTVVTGTLWSGQIRRGEHVRILPGDRVARVREVQVHDQPTDVAEAGQRVAVNLGGTSRDQVQRGDVLVTEGGPPESYLLDTELEFPNVEPEPGTRVQVHHGTRETAARAAWLGGSFWQLRLEQPLIAVAGDRLVIRRIAPPATLGGGRVLDATPRKHGPSRDLLTRLTRLARGETDPAETAGTAEPPEPEPVPEAPALTAIVLTTEEQLRAAGYEPPPDSAFDPEALSALRAAGRAVRVGRTLHYHADVLEEARGRVIATAERHGGAITLSQLRDELGTSRKFAQALLEHLDSERVTIRRGDEHLLRRRPG